MISTPSKSNRREEVQKALDNELSRLKGAFGLAGQLRVVWNPKISNEIHGKVEGSTIIIYDADEKEALKTLKHEFVEFILTEEFLTPRIIEAKNHRRADALVDIISSLI